MGLLRDRVHLTYRQISFFSCMRGLGGSIIAALAVFHNYRLKMPGNKEREVG